MTNKNCCDGQMFGPRYHTANCDRGLKAYLKNIKRIYFDTNTEWGVINLKDNRKGAIIL